MKTKFILFVSLAIVPLQFFGCAEKEEEIDDMFGNDEQAKCYYIDSKKGNDNYSGISPLSPLRTLDKVSDLDLNPGDTVLFARGSTFNETLTLSADGEDGKPIVIDAYGEGDKPKIVAPNGSMFGVHIYNCSYLTIRNIEIINHGNTDVAKRCGLKIEANNYGVSKNITVQSLDIHDVNGSMHKSYGAGAGIEIHNNWTDNVTTFENLLIEHCYIARCQRNGIMWYSGAERISNWHLNTNNVVRYNLLEEIPGDGIVPIGCDGTIIEYNVIRKCPGTLPIKGPNNQGKETAAGIWPYKCDNTIIRFNEVSDIKVGWDSQGFDADDNCNNTVIEYNYSHDNAGGFVLVCSTGEWQTNEKNIGCVGSKIRNNISVNDGYRKPEDTAGGILFSPTIHIGGAVKDTEINNNILYIGKKPSDNLHKYVLWIDSYNKKASTGTNFHNNYIYDDNDQTSFEQKDAEHEYKLENNIFTGNEFNDAPENSYKTISSSSIEEAYRSGNFENLMESRDVANGKAKVRFVSPEKIKQFFVNLEQLPAE